MSLSTAHLNWIRPVLLGVYGATLAASLVLRGVPFDREEVLLWLVSGLAVASIGRPAGPARVIRDWLPFAVLLLAYELSRGAADTLGLPVQWTLPARVDAFLFGAVPPIELQSALHPYGPPRWWEAPISLMYASHFVVPFAVAAVYWFRDRESWLNYVRRFVVLTGGALVTFVLLPTAPPWLASREGYLTRPVVRSAARGWEFLHLDIAASLLETGRASVNLVAAMPSLHAAYPALILLVTWRHASLRLRIVLVSYAVGMGFTLVATGEHYVSDVVAGWLYAGVANFAVGRWDRRRLARAY